jgi:hypothetical protein
LSWESPCARSTDFGSALYLVVVDLQIDLRIHANFTNPPVECSPIEILVMHQALTVHFFCRHFKLGFWQVTSAWTKVMLQCTCCFRTHVLNCALMKLICCFYGLHYICCFYGLHSYVASMACTMCHLWIMAYLLSRWSNLCVCLAR